jgi:transposase
MKKELRLTEKDILILKEYHRACVDKKTADKIKTILLISEGFTYPEIEKILLLDERTFNRYKTLYEEQGIDGLVADNYQGGSYKLSGEQIESLREELNSKIYPTAEAVCAWVEKTFGIKYTATGMVQTLHRLGYSYKKATSVPGKAEEKKQKAFVEMYKKEYKNLPDNEKLYFMDDCHPTFNNHIGYGWVETGKEFAIKSQTGRKRINLMGAYEPKSAETVVADYEGNLNQETTIDFLKILRKKNGEKKLHIICDNVSYQHAGAVKRAAEELNIHLVYLPGYSPNLNLIERYWGFLKKKILVNRYFSSFGEFREAILRFSRSKSKKLRVAVRKYIPEKFHLFKEFPT